MNAFAPSGHHRHRPLAASTRRSPTKTVTPSLHALAVTGCCPCGRRHLLGASTAALLPVLRSKAAVDPTGVVERFHPSRPDWYEELYANAMEQGMRSYEAEIAGYKAELFHNLSWGSKNVLELGVGTGPNFKYYARAGGLNVFGVDPNKQMEKYACAAAVAAGLPLTNFSFMRGVGEALPVRDNSMDAVVGTVVLCSVKDVDMALREVKRVLKPGGLYLFIEHVAAHGILETSRVLQVQLQAQTSHQFLNGVSSTDGSLLRFTQGILDPLQQFVADGCHLTRETGKQISGAGFSTLNLNMAFLYTVSLISPHVYGIACK